MLWLLAVIRVTWRRWRFGWQKLAEAGRGDWWPEAEPEPLAWP